jgi:hypothetical protein
MIVHVTWILAVSISTIKHTPNERRGNTHLCTPSPNGLSCRDCTCRVEIVLYSSKVRHTLVPRACRRQIEAEVTDTDTRETTVGRGKPERVTP